MTDRLAPDVIALDARFGPLAEATQRIEQLPLDGLLTYLVDNVPAAFLAELARQFHVMGLEGWRFAATDAARRALIGKAIVLHARKGTPYAIKTALAMAGIEAGLSEWWQQQPAGQPYTFTADIYVGQPAAQDVGAFALAQGLIDEWKPVSRHARYRIACAAVAAVACGAAGSAYMQVSASGDLLVQPQLGAARAETGAAGHALMLLSAEGTIH
jgi:phage tail P2-like protein